MVVASQLENQIKRLKSRDRMSREEAGRRINSQLDLQVKVKAADFVIFNDDTEAALEKKVDLLWEKLKTIRG